LHRNAPPRGNTTVYACWSSASQDNAAFVAFLVEDGASIIPALAGPHNIVPVALGDLTILGLGWSHVRGCRRAGAIRLVEPRSSARQVRSSDSGSKSIGHFTGS